MKRFFLFTLVVIMALMTACSGCKGPKEPVEPEFVTYNVDSLMIADYDYLAGQYDTIHFYESDIVMDTTFDGGACNVISVHNIFQVEDTCYMFYHDNGKDSLITVNDHWMECMDMSPRNKIGWNELMNIIEDLRSELPTRYVTFRRVLAPPFPTNGQWIFGPGILVVDGETGEVIHWDEEVADEDCVEDTIE